MCYIILYFFIELLEMAYIRLRNTAAHIIIIIFIIINIICELEVVQDDNINIE